MTRSARACAERAYMIGGGVIRIIQGSIFDSKCDLLIVPCDSTGRVTNSVYINLSERGLETQIGPIPFGGVLFRESKYEFASTVGYAASVDVDPIASTSGAIKQIAEAIIYYARENQTRIINIPLLGSGTGGMAPVESYETLRSIFANE